MITSDLQQRLHVVVVGHSDGAGRAVVWRSPGVGADGPAVRQAAVLPAGERFTLEPGWLLRKLPSGRWLLLAGGTAHEDLRDSFGRSGIFHGVGIVGTAADIGVALCAPDASALCFELAHLAIEQRLAPSKHLQAAAAHAQQHGPMKARLIPARDARTPTGDPTWPATQAALRQLGLRPMSSPVGAEPTVSWGQPAIDAKAQNQAIRIDGALATARRIIRAWSG